MEVLLILLPLFLILPIIFVVLLWVSRGAKKREAEAGAEELFKKLD